MALGVFFGSSTAIASLLVVISNAGPFRLSCLKGQSVAIRIHGYQSVDPLHDVTSMQNHNRITETHTTLASLPPILPRSVLPVISCLSPTILQRRHIALRHIDHLSETVLARRNGSDWIVHLLARGSQRVVVLVLLLHVEVYNLGAFWNLKGILILASTLPPKELSARCFVQREIVGYGAEGLLVGSIARCRAIARGGVRIVVACHVVVMVFVAGGRIWGGK